MEPEIAASHAVDECVVVDDPVVPLEGKPLVVLYMRVLDARPSFEHQDVDAGFREFLRELSSGDHDVSRVIRWHGGSDSIRNGTGA